MIKINGFDNDVWGTVERSDGDPVIIYEDQVIDFEEINEDLDFNE